MRDPLRRYRRWLRAYPEAYRSARGEEILSTLLDACSEHGRASMVDLAYIWAHGGRVRLRMARQRWARRPPMPQPARLVTWLLVGAAVVAWYDALSSHNGPRNPGVHTRGIVGGVVFVALNLLLQARRRFLYGLVTAALVAFLALAIAGGGPTTGFLVGAPYVLLVGLLLAGWRRYTAVVRD